MDAQTAALAADAIRVNGVMSNGLQGMTVGPFGVNAPVRIENQAEFRVQPGKGPVSTLGAASRRLKVIQIGAGVTGIEMAHQIQTLPNVDFVIYDKNSDLGGTWLENRYPGCACDVPAHSYSYNWAPNPNWSRWIVGAAEIHRYLCDVAEKHDLRKYMRLNCMIDAATWDEDRSLWVLQITRTVDGKTEKFQDECDVLLSGTGVLNDWKYPNVEGLWDYRGKLLHTASWDPSYDFKGKRIAVLGNGASAVQVVPELRKDAAQIDVYMRSPTWLTPTPWLKAGITVDHVYSEQEKERFAKDPDSFLAYRKSIDDDINRGWAMFYKGSKEQQGIRSIILERYKDVIKDVKLREFLSPDFDVGCRRPTPADGFLTAIHEDNVAVITHAVERMVPTGIDDRGTIKDYDAIVCATGFNTSFVPRFPILGRQGRNLQDVYRKKLQCYMGIAVAGFPNYFCFSGPISPIANGSVFPGTAMQSAYLRKVLVKMQEQNIQSLEVAADAQTEYNAWVQKQMHGLVWTSGCASWYQDETGTVRVPFPGSLLHYRQMTKDPLYEHYKISYAEGRFGWLGNGRTNEELEGHLTDYSPYICAVKD